jgi:phosphohistidine phosphatase
MIGSEPLKTMELYLLRHGIAEDGKPGGKDADRALTEEGVKRLRATLKRAREADLAPTLILTSPYIRAVQTARLAKEVLSYEGKLVESRAFTPDSSPEDAWDEIRNYSDERQVLIASHEPLMSSLTAFLLNSPALSVDFKKGALARIDLGGSMARPRGVLKWFLISKLS